MSEYRDDTQDTAVASDKTFGGLRSSVDEVLRIGDTLLFGLAMLVSSSAIASDQVVDNATQIFSDSAVITSQVIDAKQSSQLHIDQAQITNSLSYGLIETVNDAAGMSDNLVDGTIRATINDSAIASDSVTSQRTAYNLVTDSAVISDSMTAIERDVVTDSVTASDNATDRLRAVQLVNDTATTSDTIIDTAASLIIDSARIYDELIAKRIVVSLVQDNIKASDQLIFKRTDVITDSTPASDTSAGKLSAFDTLIDEGTISDSVIDNINQNTVVSESASIIDEVIDKLHATVFIADGAVIEDTAINIGGYQGQAWTANSDSWAMSRYNPYNYNRLVVIDDVLYGEADDGIYRLDQEVNAVTAIVKTGKMDLGRGQLTHPANAYLEYELNGGASMTVSTTQKGSEQQYNYMLPNEVADELTNGRFIFGRGLRGRHFAFELIMIGTHGHVNDLSIEHIPTTRRV